LPQPDRHALLERRIASILLPVTAALVLVPLAAVSIPPLHDYPFHLARADAIAALFGQVDHPTHYRIGNFLLPNVAMDVVTLGLTAFMPPLLAGRVFLGFVLLIMLSGTVALHRAIHRRRSPWPLLAALFLYNWIFLYGFTNYLFGLGMTLWGAAIWLATREFNAPLRLGVGTAVGIVTLFCHLMAFGLLAVIVGGLAVVDAVTACRASGRLDIRGLLIAAIPLLITLLVFLAASPTAGEAAQPLVYHDWIGWKPLMARRTVLSSFPWLDLVTIGPVAVMVAVAALRSRLRLAPAMILPIVLLGLTFLAMPYSLFGSLYGDARLPIAVLLVVIAALDLRPPTPSLVRASPAPVLPPNSLLATSLPATSLPATSLLATSLLATSLLAASLLATSLLAARQVAIAHEWRREEAVIATYQAAFATLPDASTLWVASAEPFPTLAYNSAEELARWHPPIKHLASLASLNRDIYVPATWADPFKQPIAVRADDLPASRFQGANPIPTPTADRLADMVSRVRALRVRGTAPRDYLLLLRPDVLSGTPPAGLVAFAHGGTFTLFRIE
jgi:hypothetical protein